MANTDKFEQIAELYDTPERMEHARLAANAIREYLADTKGKSAMDFGCGTGAVGINLLDEFGSMLFVDTSPKMLEQIEQKLLALGVPHAQTLCVDFEQERPPHLHVDCIFMVQVLLHIPDIQPLLSRLYQVLSENGHLIIVDFNPNELVQSPFVHSGFDQAELAAQMEKLGYAEIQSKTFYKGNKIFMGQDASFFVMDAKKPPSAR